MTKEILNEEVVTLDKNYKALERLSWFTTDAQNVQNWTGNLFRGGIDLADQKLVSLLAAANDAITEVEEDITELKNYLAAIIPANSK